MAHDWRPLYKDVSARQQLPPPVPSQDVAYLKMAGTLADFVKGDSDGGEVQVGLERHPFLSRENWDGEGWKVYLETYGCQMNVNDMEVVRAVLSQNNFTEVPKPTSADIALIMTCAIRERAEKKIRNRIHHLKKQGGREGLGMGRGEGLRIGLLGCMAERLKSKLLEEEPLVDLVVGPDAYRDLPRLVNSLSASSTAVNVQLSLDETYADIVPVRQSRDQVSAFVSIMRGCDNMCTYCIVPFTRGRERSRPIDSIVRNVQALAAEGVKEVILLGQNVNSYRDLSQSDRYPQAPASASVQPGFSTVYKAESWREKVHRPASCSVRSSPGGQNPLHESPSQRFSHSPPPANEGKA